MHSEALMLIMDLLRGIPNVREIAAHEMRENHNALIRGIDEITDRELRSSFQLLASYNTRLWELEQELLEIVASYYNFEAPLSPADRRTLHKKLNQHWVKPATSDWRGTQCYEEMASIVKGIELQIPGVKRHIDERLSELTDQLDSNS